MDESLPADEAARYLTTAHGGSREALGQALESCRAYLLLVANRELAGDLQAKGAPSDLVQETFLEAQRSFECFQGGSADELRAWLRQILKNNVANFARRYRSTTKRQLEREVSLYPSGVTGNCPLPIAANDPSPSTEVVAAERAAAVDAAIARLPADYRQVIEWRNREDRSFTEIAAQLDRSENAVRKLWFRAIERLKQELEAPP